MEYIINNWYYILAIIVAIGTIGFSAYKIFGFEVIKKWLLYAVIMAEKELGEKTGELKILYVYNLFTTKFPVISKFVSFTTFSAWIDDALILMKILLESNKAIAKVVIEDKI